MSSLFNSVALIKRYFPDLTETQEQMFVNLDPLFRFWNNKINLVSKYDIDFLYERHILHSLSIAKFCKFHADADVLDLGTGGGFPGIPLAILFPKVNFHLIDVIKKKTNVVYTIARDLGLNNVTVDHVGAEDLNQHYNFVVSRAVTKTDAIYKWTKSLLKKDGSGDMPNGVILLKGGEPEPEIKNIDAITYQIKISEFFEEIFFADKYILYLTP